MLTIFKGKWMSAKSVLLLVLMLASIFGKYKTQNYSYDVLSDFHLDAKNLVKRSLLTYNFLELKDEINLLQFNTSEGIITEKSIFIDDVDVGSLFSSIEASMLDFQGVGESPINLKDLYTMSLEVSEILAFQRLLQDEFTTYGAYSAKNVIKLQKYISLGDTMDKRIDSIIFLNREKIKELSEITKEDVEYALILDKWAAMLTGAVVILSFMALTVNVTEQHKLNVKLHDSALKEEEALNNREQFMTNMSHELRTPLNTIVGYADLLNKTDLNENQRKFQYAITSSSNVLLNTINHFLDFKKMESGHIQLTPVSFSLPQINEDIALIFEGKCKAKNLTLSTVIQQPIPARVVGDIVRIKEVLINLMGNAIKFTNEGSITLNMACESNADNPAKVTLVFKVSDTGVGISEQQQEHIFEQYYQVNHGADRKYAGTGLGLTIANQIVKLMNGELNIEKSGIGKGSTFTMRIPLEVEKGGKVDQVSHVADERDWSWSNGQKILVVDDILMNLDLAKHIFEQWNFIVLTATSGQVALDILSTDHVDMVLLDIQMPEMDGYTVATKIRKELNLNTPLIALSAYSGSNEYRKALEAGMNDFIIKPFKEKELWEVLVIFLKGMSEPINKSAIDNNLTYIKSLSRGNVDFEKKMVDDIVIQLSELLGQAERIILEGKFQGLHKIVHMMTPTIEMIGLSNLLETHMETLSSSPEKDKDLVLKSFRAIQESCMDAIKKLNLEYG